MLGMCCEWECDVDIAVTTIKSPTSPSSVPPSLYTFVISNVCTFAVIIFGVLVVVMVVALCYPCLFFIFANFGDISLPL